MKDEKDNTNSYLEKRHGNLSKVWKENHVIFLGILIMAVVWLIESAVHTFVFLEGSFIDQVFIPNNHEIWMRIIVFIVIIVYSFYAKHIIKHKNRADMLLQEKADQIKLVLKGANLATWDMDERTNEYIIDERLVEIFEREIESDSEWALVIHPDDLQRVTDYEKKATETNNFFFTCEYRILTPSGKIKWVSDYGRIVERDKEGNPIRSAGILQDITDRKNVEAKLQKEIDLNRTLIEKSPVCTKIISLDSILEFMSSSGLESLNADPETIIGQHYPLSFYPESTKKLLAKRLNQAKKGEITELEALSLDTEGNEVWFQTTFIPVKGEDGEIEYVIGISITTTERKMAEKALLKKTDDLSKRVRELNCLYNFASYISKSGLEPESTYQDLVDIIPSGWNYPEVTAGRIIINSKEYKTKNFKKTEWKQSSDVEFFQEKKGALEIYYLEEKPSLDEGPFLREEREMINALASMLSERMEKKSLENQLLLSQKMEATSVLAGGIAHDFNNILSGIMGNASLAEDESGEEQKRHIKEITKAAKRATGLTQQLLAFAKGGIATSTKISSVSKIISDTADFALGKSSISKCAMDFSDNLWPVNVDAWQIAQIIQNLVINANQAMPDGGIINIAAKNIEDPHEIGEGPYIHVSVSDKGTGIPKKHLGKIFEPYFSTKSQKGAGSGLGLAVAHNVIKKHNGEISVESIEGHGTTFHIYIPAVKGAILDAKSEEAETKTQKSCKILVMEDEVMIQEMIMEMLYNLGHKVVPTNNGTEALEEYSSAIESKKPFDLVILDLTIPGGMGGVETLRKLKELDPNVVSIISSGYADKIPEGFNAAIPKPYTKEELRDVVAKTMQN